MLTQKLGGGQRTRLLIRRILKRRQVSAERLHPTRRFIRFEKTQHTAGAGGKHRRAGLGAAVGKGEGFLRKNEQTPMFFVGKRDAFAGGKIERTHEQRRTKPQQSKRKERRKRVQAEKSRGNQRDGTDGTGCR